MSGNDQFSGDRGRSDKDDDDSLLRGLRRAFEAAPPADPVVEPEEDEAPKKARPSSELVRSFMRQEIGSDDGKADADAASDVEATAPKIDDSWWSTPAADSSAAKPDTPVEDEDMPEAVEVSAPVAEVEEPADDTPSIDWDRAFADPKAAVVEVPEAKKEEKLAPETIDWDRAFADPKQVVVAREDSPAPAFAPELADDFQMHDSADSAVENSEDEPDTAEEADSDQYDDLPRAFDAAEVVDADEPADDMEAESAPDMPEPAAAEASDESADEEGVDADEDLNAPIPLFSNALSFKDRSDATSGESDGSTDDEEAPDTKELFANAFRSVEADEATSEDDADVDAPMAAAEDVAAVADAEDAAVDDGPADDMAVASEFEDEIETETEVEVDDESEDESEDAYALSADDMTDDADDMPDEATEVVHMSETDRVEEFTAAEAPAEDAFDDEFDASFEEEDSTDEPAPVAARVRDEAAIEDSSHVDGDQTIAPMAASIPSRLVAKADARRPRVCLMGEFSAGKSTLSNLLIGQSAVPVNVTATQLPPVWLSYGDDAPYRVDLDGQEHDVELERLEDVSVHDTNHIRIFKEAKLLQICDLIDMPGISDPNMAADVWQRVIHHADIVIWCSHATQAWRQSEAAVWATMPHELYAKSLLLLTRMDRILSERDRMRVVRRVEKETEGMFRKVLPVSLLKALEAGDDADAFEDSGAQAMTEALVDAIDEVAGRRPKSRIRSNGAPVDAIVGEEARTVQPKRIIMPVRVKPKGLETRMPTRSARS